MKSPALNHPCGFRGPIRRSGVFSSAATLVVILTSAALSSCSGYTISANAIGQPAAPGGADPGAGVLSPTSTSLSFGNIAVGSTGTQTVSLTNMGTAAVNISTASISSGAAFTIVGTNPSGSIPVGQSTSVQVQFAPISDIAVAA